MSARLSMTIVGLLTLLSALLAQLSIGGASPVSPVTGDLEARAAPVIQKTGLPGSWQYKGCYAEPTTGTKIFPYESIWLTSNSVAACLNLCAEYGLPAAGLEEGQQCYCGDPSDISTNGGTLVADSEALTYFWTGPNPLFVWNAPAVTGHYEFFIGGLIVPLIATVGINNKVAFLEKFGSSEFPNSTGAYELDLSLANNFKLAWRTMHVKSDVFCSGGIVLPDRGARQINVGGWKAGATFGVRLYYPDGKPGVPGTHDWQENVNELTLQRSRWYPTVLMMPNGSILVVGGQAGVGGAPNPNLEILPKPHGGDTVITLDFLDRTSSSDLYPFLIVLPSGNIFIGDVNEARILNAKTFAVIRVLPNMPGAVNNPLGGRTYPTEGSAVPLPQHAPYTDPLKVLVCGGSTQGSGVGLDTCITIAPEVANPTWTIERMPSKRVMPCIVPLPDGTYMIMNGAHHGFAGFGNEGDPNYNAILYDPTKPVNQRFSILASTIVARLYHSEATLLPDATVLVSGSDPQSPGYPEEFRIEKYIPPYLATGLKQPTFTIPVTDWALGGHYSIVVTLFHGTTATMRVSLIAAISSTHGNIMGARTIFPAFTCAGNKCTITAPPNANVCPPGWHQLFVLDGPTPSHSAWVRIGGDPGKLGNWPNFPDFTLPGV